MGKFYLKNKDTLYFIPTIVLFIIVLIKSYFFQLHDFSNSFFPADIIKSNLSAEKIIFDIYEFNNYIWSQGYTDVFADFYINSPFNAFLLYPFTFLSSVFTAKLIFNLIGCFLFLFSIYKLCITEIKKDLKWLLLLPLLFYVPIRNQILFGQSYFIVVSLLIFSYLALKKNKDNLASLLLSMAILIKIFPILFLTIFIFNKKYSIILKTCLASIGLILLSTVFLGPNIWLTYILDVIPNAILNKSIVNYQYNAQSLEVFFKRIFLFDAYYNPTASLSSFPLYVILKLILKSIIFGFAIQLSLLKRKDLFALFSIWIVTLFLVQSSISTYTQILWIIPFVYIFKNSNNIFLKYSFLSVLLLICNFPFDSFLNFNVFVKFSRLWFMILLAIIFFSSFGLRIKYRFMALVFLAFTPFQLWSFNQNRETVSTYVLEKQESFIVYDYFVKDNLINYSGIGKNGPYSKSTNILVSSMDSTQCFIKNNQIFYNNKQLTFDYSLKKKPLLINNSSVYYLTDLNSRRGAFTIKKIILKSDK